MPSVTPSTQPVDQVQPLNLSHPARGTAPGAAGLAAGLAGVLAARNAPPGMELTEQSMRALRLQRTSAWVERHPAPPAQLPLARPASPPPPTPARTVTPALIQDYIDAQRELAASAATHVAAAALESAGTAGPYHVLFRVDHRTPLQIAAAGGFMSGAQSTDRALSGLERRGLVRTVPTVQQANAQIARFGESDPAGHWYLYCIDAAMRSIAGASAAPDAAGQSVVIRADWSNDRIYLCDSNDANAIPLLSDASNHLFGMPLALAAERYTPDPLDLSRGRHASDAAAMSPSSAPSPLFFGALATQAAALEMPVLAAAAPRDPGTGSVNEERIHAFFQRRRGEMLVRLQEQTGLTRDGPPAAGGTFSQILDRLCLHIADELNEPGAERLRVAVQEAIQCAETLGPPRSTRRLIAAMEALHEVLLEQQPAGAKRGPVFDMRANVAACIRQLNVGMERLQRANSDERTLLSDAAEQQRLRAARGAASAARVGAPPAASAAAAPPPGPDSGGGTLPDWLQSALDAPRPVPPVATRRSLNSSSANSQNRHYAKIVVGAIIDHTGMDTGQFGSGKLARMQSDAEIFVARTVAIRYQNGLLRESLLRLAETINARQPGCASMAMLSKFRRELSQLATLFRSLGETLASPADGVLADSLAARAIEIGDAVRHGQMEIQRFVRAVETQSGSTAPAPAEPADASGHARYARMRAAAFPGRGAFGAAIGQVGMALSAVHAEDVSSARRQNADRESARALQSHVADNEARAMRYRETQRAEASGWSSLNLGAAAAAVDSAGRASPSAAQQRATEWPRRGSRAAASSAAPSDMQPFVRPPGPSFALSTAPSLASSLAAPRAAHAATAAAWRPPVNTRAHVVSLTDVPTSSADGSPAATHVTTSGIGSAPRH